MEEINTVDQLTIAKKIASEMPQYTINEVQKIIQREQELTMYAISKGAKVVKKNYITLYPMLVKERTMVSPLNGQMYTIPEHMGVGIKVGEGFKTMVAKRKMPQKICRSVERIPA